ncbi:NAD(P)H-dependent oxidoreductase [Methylosinus sp. H3A]|nr:NAD(P)H-dependent oxidoreductase [Methylosinus sp. H3A]
MVVVTGNTHRPSKSQALAAAIVEAAQLGPAVSTEIYDIVDAGPGLGGSLRRDDLPWEAARIVDAIEHADGLVVAVPIYKASYPGLFKHLFDFVDPSALERKPVALAATGGGFRHALAVEHQLRPLFGFFSAHSLPTGVFVSDANYRDGKIVDEDVIKRIGALAGELTDAIERRGAVSTVSTLTPSA